MFYGFLVLLGVITVVFLLFNVLPGDPARMMLGQRADQTSIDAINKDFGSFAAFKEQFSKAATTHFASGWAWLTKNADGKLEISSTLNAGTPITEGTHALLTCDVWEHAYYVDTRNDRAKYVGNFWELVNWDFVAANFAK